MLGNHFRQRRGVGRASRAAPSAFNREERLDVRQTDAHAAIDARRRSIVRIKSLPPGEAAALVDEI